MEIHRVVWTYAEVCTEVCGAMWKSAEGCADVHRGVWRSTELCGGMHSYVAVHRATERCVEMHRATQRCAELCRGAIIGLFWLHVVFLRGGGEKSGFYVN